jgi:Tol biopolymer transport system component
MIKTLNHALRTFILMLAAVSVLAACSIEISDVTPLAPTTRPQATSAAEMTEAPELTATLALTATPRPPAWADLNLTGSLVYSQGTLGLMSLDLETGEKIALLQSDEKIWLSAAATSPDGQTIALAYSPPPTGQDVQLGYTGLYGIPADGSATSPTPILERTNPQESYFSPEWTPDGKYLYYAHFVPIFDEAAGNSFKYTIERIPYPPQASAPEIIVEDAIWPKVSPDGNTIAFLKFDTVAYTQELYLSDIDGGNPTPLLPAGEFPSVDAQFFSPDGKTIIFNAVGEGQAPALSFIDQLMGIQAADAHNVPSDWWSVTLGANEPPVRLTQLYDTGMYGDYSADGNWVAFIAASGIYVMKPDGTEVTPLIPIDALGTLEWEE